LTAALSRAAPPEALAGRLSAAALVLGYRSEGGERHRVLDGVDLDVPAGTAIAITGPSGSGKTSLIHLLTGIELPQAGHVRWGGVEITQLSERARDRWRRLHVGLIFQDFHLIQGMSVLSNVVAPCLFDRFAVPAELRARARGLLDRLGVPPGRNNVASLSRGEQQRVALARALLRAPPILIADEPTASLDADNGRMVIDRLLETVAETGATLLVVTHDPQFLARLELVYELHGGRLSRRG
jgi:putative ABC transport system ATP-binding protein